MIREGKIALMVPRPYANFSDSQLIEHMNGNIICQLFCSVHIAPHHPLTNTEIVNAIRQELADRLYIEFLQLILFDRWKPYLANLHMCMIDTTYYESHLRFPTDVKLSYGFIGTCVNIAWQCTNNILVISILM